MVASLNGGGSFEVEAETTCTSFELFSSFSSRRCNFLAEAVLRIFFHSSSGSNAFQGCVAEAGLYSGRFSAVTLKEANSRTIFHDFSMECINSFAWLWCGIESSVVQD